MVSNIDKKVKALISGLIVNDKNKINRLVNELTESILPEKDEKLMKIITESFKGETNV